MKKNIILTVIILILLIVIGWFSYNYGIKQGEKRAEKNIFSNKLEKKCSDDIVSLKELVDPQSLKECNQLSIEDARENCRMIFTIKQVKQSGDKKECLVLKDENNKKGCETVALITTASKKQKPELCNSLPGIEINSCLSRVIERIIKTDPDAKWCNSLKDIQGPDRDSCLLDVKEIKQQQAAVKLLDTE